MDLDDLGPYTVYLKPVKKVNEITDAHSMVVTWYYTANLTP